MKIVENILVATDFLRSSGQLLDNAATLAQTFQSNLLILHVLPSEVKNEKVKKLLEQAAGQHMKDALARPAVSALDKVETIIKWGINHELISELAKARDANLIVMGAGEKAEKQSYELGSTAEKVVRQAIPPVLVIEPGSKLEVQHILCPVDFSKPSARALKDAIVFARRFDARLTILSVYEPVATGIFGFKYDVEEDNKRIAASHTREFDKFLEGFNLKGVKWNKEVRKGKPEVEILAEIRQSGPGLLIMGTTGRSGLSKMMVGSVTEKVIREVPCSFITTKTQDVIQLQLAHRVRDIESHYKVAGQLMADGFFEEAIREFEACLKVNDMYVPALYGLAKVYDKMDNGKMAEKYRKIALDVMHTIWDRKIEDEIRKYYSR